MAFRPRYRITGQIARNLMRIEAARQAVSSLPLNPAVLAGLRDSARLMSTHYSTQIEGNRLTPAQIRTVLQRGQATRRRGRDEDEVRGYYTALAYAESYAGSSKSIDERFVQQLHALVMGGGRKRCRPSAYRDGQNVIRDARSGAIVYLPPESNDVPLLMAELFHWMNSRAAVDPAPLVAGIVHYQFATIHPYYDGNGRVARLLTSTLLRRHGYDLRGIYNLDEYYAKRLDEYYARLQVGKSHNYYMGRASADITRWIAFFIHGMADSFEAVRQMMQRHASLTDDTALIRSLDARQRKVLALFDEWDEITSAQVAEVLRLSPRGVRRLLRQWVIDGFLVVGDPSKRGRSYRLAIR